MSARAFEAPEGSEGPEGSDAIHGGVHRETPRDDVQILGFPDWHPNLNGPHWQPTGGPNGAPFSIAIGRPGNPPKSEKEVEFLELCRREMENAHQIIFPDDDDDEEEAGPPHRDPVEGSTSPRKLGTTATGWEVWHDKQRTYYYNRATDTTKYSWSKAEIEADEQRFAQAANSSSSELSSNRNNQDVPLAMRTTKAEPQP